MSESISSSSARHSRLPSVASSSASIEESSPLLTTPSVDVPIDGSKSYGSDDLGTTAPQSERLSTSKLLWIMISVWIGTFLAGLGEQCLRNTTVALAVSARNDS